MLPDQHQPQVPDEELQRRERPEQCGTAGLRVQITEELPGILERPADRHDNHGLLPD